VNHRTTATNGSAVGARNYRTTFSPAWRSLAIAGLTLTTQSGLFMAFPVLYVALLAEFAWSRAEGAAIQSLATLVMGVATPAAGLLLDRFGPHRLFPLAALVLALGLAGAGIGRTLWHLYLAYGLVGGLGHSTLASTPNMVVVSKWFGHARGRAIGLVDLGTGLGSALFVPTTQLLISWIGWRATLLAHAALLAALLVPLNRLQRFPPTAVAGAPPGPATAGGPWTLARATRSPAFWALAFIRFAAGLAFHMTNVHVVPFLVGLGRSALAAASTLGAVSLVSMAGRVLVGMAADRLGRELALTLAFASAAGGIAMLPALAATGAPAFLFLFIALYGLSQGSGGIVTIAKAADLFQGPRLATIAGWITIASGVGEAAGAWFGGYVYDRTGGYGAAFAVALAGLASSVGAMWAAGLTTRRVVPRVSP
jgi:MFS family permease